MTQTPFSVPTFAPTYADVADAAHRLHGMAHHTPVLRSTTADERLGAQLFFKCENLQRTGAFKFRGAFNTLAQFTDEQRKGGVLAFSAGNHAQAIAMSARLLDMPAVIVMPEDAPAAKMAATRGYGAQVVTYNRYTEDREAISRRLAQERGMSTLPPLMTMPTRAPCTSTLPCSAPAKASAPVGSTMIFMRSAKNRRACTSCSSVVVTMSSARRWMMGKVIWPSAWVCAPSAMVWGVGICTI